MLRGHGELVGRQQWDIEIEEEARGRRVSTTNIYLVLVPCELGRRGEMKGVARKERRVAIHCSHESEYLTTGPNMTTTRRSIGICILYNVGSTMLAVNDPIVGKLNSA